MDFVYDFVGEAVALGVDSLILGICIKQLIKCRNIISSLNSAPTLEINNDLKTELNKYPNNAINYVVLRGLVKPLGSTMKSNANDSITGVIQRLRIKEHLVARTTTGFWTDQTRTVHEVENIVPFVIVGENMSVEIIDAFDASILDLDMIADHFEPSTPSIFDHLWGFFSGVRQRGLQTTEEMLRVGTNITAIGELSGSKTGVLKLQPPKSGLPLYLTTATKGSVLKKIGESKDFLRILIVIFGSMAVVLSGRILYKYISRKKKLQAEKRIKEQLAVSRRERRTKVRDSNLIDSQICVVCTENPKEIILLPCGHVSICEDCSESIKDLCPVCRTPIESKAPAFIT